MLDRLQMLKATCNTVFLAGYHTVRCNEEYETRCFEHGKLFLRCLNCGWESAGWEIGEAL